MDDTRQHRVARSVFAHRRFTAKDIQPNIFAFVSSNFFTLGRLNSITYEISHFLPYETTDEMANESTN
jgi:hypothetical protein